MCLLLKNGNVLNVESGVFIKQDIVIKDCRIIQVAENIKSSYQEVDCEGKWIIPGLIDMHVHIKHGFAPLFTAAGVTTVRNTAGSLIELEELMSENPQCINPRIISANRMIDGPPGLWGETSPYNLNTDDEDVARQEVRRQVQLGADFIKVYGWLSKGVMEAVVDEAKKHNKEVSCDLIHATAVTAVDAANMGIKWNEHGSGILQAIFPQWTMQATQDVWAAIDWEKPDEEKITKVCQQLKHKGVILCPTMMIFDQANRLQDYWTTQHAIMDKIKKNEGLINQWEQFLNYSAALKQIGIQYRYTKKIAYMYHQIGGLVVAGTDTPAGIFTFPGLALHRELMLFVESGFTEIEAIRAATSNAAKALEREDLGHIQENGIADLVILNANPLINIENTMDIHLVVKGGRPLEQQDIFEHIPSSQQQAKFFDELMTKFKAHQLL
ncbi:amidohydrolase family protein [Metasolibacillus meyeri]|uniref:amidohydrolase family protein n=1 Tax=Metasolibacillus meyeri TaxID=1071052 RepID=UPI000D31F264|nr:amidohydrolase family protein [Metasolibacillus meyeri]